MKFDYKPWLVFKDIRFWIMFFFLLRMYGITMPPLEMGHNWRQTDGLMIARNFYENTSNIFFPAVDLAGDKSGVVGSEFPILNYLIYLTSLVFGYEHWYGRIIVLIFSSIGILFFHKLIKKYFDESSAFNASIILLVSLWFSYSRKIIPDTFAVSLCLISLYYALQYFETGKWRHLLLFFGLGLVGCLAKILAATILTVLLIPILNMNIYLQKKLFLSFFSIVILVSVSTWYFVWVPHLNTTYGFQEHFFMGTSFEQGGGEILKNWPLVLKRFYGTPLKYFGFIVFLISVFYIIKKEYWLILMVFAIPFFSYILILVKTGASIIADHYYLITVIPSMAFIAGCGLAKIANKKIVSGILIIIGIECIADQVYDFRIRQPYKSLEHLEAIMDSVSKSNDLIAVNAQAHNPTVMYFAHRRGWVAPNALLSDSTYLHSIREKGCKYVVVAVKLYGDLELNFPKVHQSEYFKIYSIK